jgi:hypothetical protein
MPARHHAVLLVARSLAGCARAEVAADEPAPAAPAVTAAPSSEASEPAAEDDAMPGPLRARLGVAVALEAACAGCHEEVAAEHRGSRHRQASTNAAYRAALALEPSAFCRGCHAPEADPRKAPPPAVSRLGVGCVTCHVTEEGVVLAAPRAGAAEDAPHPLRRSVDFARTGGCAGCHEFRFPAMPGDDDAAFMQTTVREHRRSSSAGRACASCHMPLREGRRSHAFSEVRDPAFLRESLRATAERTRGGVRVTLAQRDPGHAFPTGDLFRRLEVGAEVRTEDGEVVGREVRHLARHFLLLPGRPERVLVGDDRVFDAPAAVDLPLPAPPPGPAVVRWWVSYQRVATVGTGTGPEGARIESEVTLHSGDLTWKD